MVTDRHVLDVLRQEVMQSIPLSGMVLVTSPQDLAGMVVRKAAQMTQRLGAPIIGLVENMSYVTCPKCGEGEDSG